MITARRGRSSLRKKLLCKNRPSGDPGPHCSRNFARSITLSEGSNGPRCAMCHLFPLPPLYGEVSSLPKWPVAEFKKGAQTTFHENTHELAFLRDLRRVNDKRIVGAMELHSILEAHHFIGGFDAAFGDLYGVGRDLRDPPRNALGLGQQLVQRHNLADEPEFERL